MDPRFSFLVFMARALRAWATKEGKTSVHNLPYGPSTRLIRGIYRSNVFIKMKRQGNLINTFLVGSLFSYSNFNTKTWPCFPLVIANFMAIICFLRSTKSKSHKTRSLLILMTVLK